MAKDSAYSQEHVAVNALSFEYRIDVAPVTAELFGKPACRTPLLAEFFFDELSYVNHIQYVYVLFSLIVGIMSEMLVRQFILFL